MLIGASGSPPGFGWIFWFFGRFWSVWGPRGTFNPNPEFLPYRLDETDRSALSGGLGEFFCFICLFLEKEGPFFKSCASSGFAWQGPLFSGKRGSFFLSHVLAVVFPGRGLCFLEKEVPGFPDAAAADAGTIWESGQAPPLTPRDGICRKGKPLAPSCTI